MSRFSYLIVGLLLCLPAVRIEAEEAINADSTQHDIACVVDHLENALQRKHHPPFDEFIAETATFQGVKPLRQSLMEGKPVEFKPDSQRYWLSLSNIDPDSDFGTYMPKGVDGKKSVLVFRDMDTKQDERFRVLYWLSKINGKWMVVYLADGWSPNEPLASAAKILPKGDPPPPLAQASIGAFPNSMLGFLSPGNHLSIHYPRTAEGGTDDHFSVRILDDAAWQIAHDARLLSIDELRKKHPAIDAFVSKELAEYTDKLARRNESAPKGRRYVPEISLMHDFALLCTVVHVGDDYVLVSYGDENAKRRVYPSQFLKVIYWSSGFPQIRIDYQLVDIEETEP